MATAAPFPIAGTNEIDALIERLRRADARFRGEIGDGGAGRATLREEPSGNVIELFEFKKDRA